MAPLPSCRTLGTAPGNPPKGLWREAQQEGAAPQSPSQSAPQPSGTNSQEPLADPDTHLNVAVRFSIVKMREGAGHTGNRSQQPQGGHGVHTASGEGRRMLRGPLRNPRTSPRAWSNRTGAVRGDAGTRPGAPGAPGLSRPAGTNGVQPES